MKHKTKLLTALVVLILALFEAYTQVSHTNKTEVVEYDRSVRTKYGQPIKVLRAVDGDTVELINGERLRYIGIDTPESVDERKPVQCYAHEASDANKRMVEGKMITFQKDVSAQDQYGRWLGYVYLEDGTFVNMELVKQGYAFAYRYAPDTAKAADFKAAEAQAKAGKLGLWASCSVTKLSSGREQTNAVQ